MSEWKTYKLGDLVTFQRGHDLSKNQFIDGKYPIAGSNGIIGYHNEFTTKAPGITIGRSGNIGNPYYYNQDFWAHNTTLYVKEFKDCDPKFVYYLLKTLNFNAHNSGSAVPSLNRNYIHPINVTAPDLSTQSQISSILSSLDDKIELNLQMNQTLEAMAQAIFKEWFVNFNFPGFDGELVKGLPKGWRKGNVLQIAKLLSGGTPKTDVEEYWNGRIKWISAKDITANNKRFITQTEKQITQLGVNKSAAKLLPQYTTIVSARGTVGNYCILSEEMAISQSNYGLRSLSGSDFFLFILIENMIEMMKAFSYGTVFDTITTKTFEEMEITLPTDDIIQTFEKSVQPIFLKMLENQKLNQSLSEIRDTLLPKLMTGKIEIKN